MPMNLLLLVFGLFASFSSAESLEPQVCITVYTSDVTFANMALTAASEQKDLFNVESLKLERSTKEVVVYLEGSNASGTELSLEVRMKQDCETGEAIVLSITGPTILL
jgi:hypothetical protein